MQPQKLNFEIFTVENCEISFGCVVSRTPFREKHLKKSRHSWSSAIVFHFKCSYYIQYTEFFHTFPTLCVGDAQSFVCAALQTRPDTQKLSRQLKFSRHSTLPSIKMTSLKIKAYTQTNIDYLNVEAIQCKLTSDALQ